jgi:NDP-sugar pyrophosphorylase family protein
MADFIEKPEHPPSNLASTGVFVLDQHIFDYQPVVETNGEFYHTNMTREYAKKYPIRVVEQKMWIPIGYPEDIQRAEEILGKMD